MFVSNTKNPSCPIYLGEFGIKEKFTHDCYISEKKTVQNVFHKSCIKS